MSYPKIIIVDDQPEWSGGLVPLLEHRGFSVVVVERGDVGVELAKHGDQALVMLDWLLQYSDGMAHMDFINSVRSSGWNGRILVMSQFEERKNEYQENDLPETRRLNLLYVPKITVAKEWFLDNLARDISLDSERWRYDSYREL